MMRNTALVQIASAALGQSRQSLEQHVGEAGPGSIPCSQLHLPWARTQGSKRTGDQHYLRQKRGKNPMFQVWRFRPHNH